MEDNLDQGGFIPPWTDRSSCYYYIYLWIQGDVVFRVIIIIDSEKFKSKKNPVAILEHFNGQKFIFIF